MKRLIIYDLDGTLVDTEADLVQAVNYTLSRLGVPPKTVPQIRALVGRGLVDLISKCLETEDPMRVKDGATIFGAYYREHLADHSALYPGAQELLAHLGGDGRIQAVVTNKPAPYAHELLQRLRVDRHFLEIISAGQGHPKKPDPAAVRHLLARIGAAPDDAVMVGDSPVDVETARNAGVETVVLSHGFASLEELRASKPDAILSSFAELLAFVRARGW